MKLTEAEWQVMKALWAEHPATARQIMDRLPPGIRWAYTTIKTMLNRLVEKQIVSETKQSGVSLYNPIISERKAKLSAVRALLDQAFDGATGPLVHFIVEEEQLTSKQRRELEQMLHNQDADEGERP